MKREEIIGYVGMGLITFNTIPSIVQALKSGIDIPITGVVLMVAGLICFLYNSIKTGNTLYTVANGIGLVGNLILLGAILK